MNDGRAMRLNRPHDETEIRRLEHATAKGSYFAGISTINPNSAEPYVKLSGARTDTRVAMYSNTVSTLHYGPCGLTTEHAFGHVPGAKGLSEPGDSGSAILSANNMIVAMLWGGGKFATRGDLTYATPIQMVLRDVEEKMGWEVDTCKLLTSTMTST